MSTSWRQRLKPLAASLGIESSAFLWVRWALAQYDQKLQRVPRYREWLEQNKDWIPTHWAHETITRKIDLAHTASQLFEITEMIRSRMPLGPDTQVLDAGASNGKFLSLLGVKHGTGVNFLPACVDKIRADGYAAFQSDVEQMPFKDKSFDFVICTETLEHVFNPLRTLNELGRLCRQKIFVTIPWMPRTRINSKPAGWPDVESHIFEFNVEDFHKIVTFSNLSIVHEATLEAFPQPWNPLLRWWIATWMSPHFFQKFQYYELKPNP